MNNLLSTFFILILLCSCSSQEETFPEHLIKKEQMVDIIAEIELTQAFIKLKTAHTDSINQEVLYQNVFERFSVTKKKFNESLTYYASDPEQLEFIYDQVIIKLSEDEAEYQGILDSEVED